MCTLTNGEECRGWPDPDVRGILHLEDEEQVRRDAFDRVLAVSGGRVMNSSNDPFRRRGNPAGSTQDAIAPGRAPQVADSVAIADAESLRQLIEDLRKLTADSLDRSLRKVFEGADEALFARARRAANNREQTSYLEAMRTVRLARSFIQQRFAQEIDRGFLPSTVPGASPSARNRDELTLTDTAVLEKSIAISNIASRASDLYKQPLFQLGGRLTTLIRHYRAPVSPGAFAPTVICEAFRRAVDTQNLEVGIALVLYGLFDQRVIPDLSPLYTQLLGVFDRYSIRPERIPAKTRSHQEPPRSPSVSSPVPPAPVASTDPRGDSAPAPPAPSAAVTAGSTFANRPGASATHSMEDHEFAAFEHPPLASIDAGKPDPSLKPLRPGEHALQMLQGIRSGLHADTPGGTYTDQRLADDLIGAALGRVVPGWEPAHAKAYVRRTDAVGQMFNSIMDDPIMPGALRPRFDELRFSVVKTALQDVDFFANPQHPVRGLVNDLATLAASARASSLDMLQRIEQLVGQIQDQFRVAAESVRHPRIDPLEQTRIEGFLADQINQNRQRRKAVIDKARRVVEEELQLRSAGHRVPNPAMSLLRSGWAPMMSAHLLRHGMDCPPWREGLALLEAILKALDTSSPSPAGGAAKLVAEIDRQLAAAGMMPTRRKELVDAFLPALLQAEIGRRRGTTPPTVSSSPGNASAATAAAPASSSASGLDREESLVHALMIPGNWFRITDARTGTHRWLKAVSYYPGRGTVAFAEFNGRNALFLQRREFLEGLLDGSIEPIELLPAARDLLARFRAHQVQRTEDS